MKSRHYFWDRLVRDRGNLDTFLHDLRRRDRELPGSASDLLQSRRPTRLRKNHSVSAYATSHPWEDFAETWAHYLHIVDTMEMARAFNLHVEPRIDDSGQLEATIDFNSYKIANFQTIVDGWLPVSFAMNNINRCMGQPDLYPFILSPAVIDKLAFIHELVREKPSPPVAVAPAAEPGELSANASPHRRTDARSCCAAHAPRMQNYRFSRRKTLLASRSMQS